MNKPFFPAQGQEMHVHGSNKKAFLQTGDLHVNSHRQLFDLNFQRICISIRSLI